MQTVEVNLTIILNLKIDEILYAIAHTVYTEI